MKTLYIDCGMGAAGDMLTAALLDVCKDESLEKNVQELNDMGIPGVVFKASASSKCGITGLHMNVFVNGVEEAEKMFDHHHEEDHGEEHHHHHEEEHHHEHNHHEHHHSSMADIMRIVNGLNVSSQVKTDIENVYRIIAEAESSVHGVPVTNIHFHEVGTMDAIADIAAVCFLLEKIDADKIIASPVHVGSGQVRCAHGILPVPAPATAYILQGIPMYSSVIKGELCTPTGAALLKYFADDFTQLPLLVTDSIGYGMGKKDFERANCVRVILGKNPEEKASFAETDKPATASFDKADEQIIELSCNIDDMTGEELGFATNAIMESGARDVFIIPIIMKKGRPAHLLRVIGTLEYRDKLVKAIFKYTSTIGIRETLCNRYILDRTIEETDTVVGRIRKKTVSGYGVTRSKYEYEDLAAVAKKKDMSVSDVRKMLSKD